MQKMAILALVMASSMALVAERSHHHQKPRHLAFCSGRSGWSFRVQIEIELVGLEGAVMTASHFDGFKGKALSLANFPTIWICCWRDDKLLVMVRMSSA